MKRHVCRLLPILLLIPLVLVGCGKSGRPRYTIYMVNRTPRDFEGVAVYFDNKLAADKGSLVKGGCASFGYVTLPIPAEAEVRWIDQGAKHAPRVKLEGRVPANPIEMNIYFIIENDESVTVAAVGQSDSDGNFEVTKGIEKLRDKQK